MLDSLQIIFWSVTYFLIIIAGWRSREQKAISMPYVAGLLNFGWELCALHQSQGFWGHILWLGMDVVIFSIGFLFLSTEKRKLLYISSTYVITLGLFYLFARYDGMLYSVFTIDLIVVVLFLVDRKRLSPELKVAIAVTKLIGSAFAGAYYGPGSIVVVILAGLVFLCNIVYLYLCCRERDSKKAEKR